MAIVPPNSPMQGTHSWDSLLDDILRGGEALPRYCLNQNALMPQVKELLLLDASGWHVCGWRKIA